MYLFIPHCHGNGLVIGGVYSRYTCDSLMGSQITVGFTDKRWVHGYTHERLIGCRSPWTMVYKIVIANGLRLQPEYDYSASALYYILATVLFPGL